MAAGYVQHATNSTSVATSLAATLTGVTAGNAIFVVVGSSSNLPKTYTATDDVDAGSYTNAIHIQHANGRTITILYYGNSTGGNTQVTVTPSGNQGNWWINPVEVSGAGATPTVVADSFSNVAGTTHYAAAASGFSPPADSLILAGITFNATPTSISPGASYSGMYNNAAHPSGIAEYRATASLLTNHRPTCTTTSSARLGPGACVHIAAAAAGGAASFPFQRYYQQGSTL